MTPTSALREPPPASPQESPDPRTDFASADQGDALHQCDAVLIALASRRFVIVRREGTIPIWSSEQLCRPVRQFRRGEPVFYKGERDVVRGMTVY